MAKRRGGQSIPTRRIRLVVGRVPPRHSGRHTTPLGRGAIHRILSGERPPAPKHGRVARQEPPRKKRSRKKKRKNRKR